MAFNSKNRTFFESYRGDFQLGAAVNASANELKPPWSLFIYTDKMSEPATDFLGIPSDVETRESAHLLSKRMVIVGQGMQELNSVIMSRNQKPFSILTVVALSDQPIDDERFDLVACISKGTDELYLLG